MIPSGSIRQLDQMNKTWMDICNAATPHTLPSGPVFRCADCGKTTDTKSTHRSHRLMCSAKLHKCRLCYRGYARKDTLKVCACVHRQDDDEEKSKLTRSKAPCRVLLLSPERSKEEAAPTRITTRAQDAHSSQRLAVPGEELYDKSQTFQACHASTTIV